MSGGDLNLDLISKEGDMVNLLREYKTLGGSLERVKDILNGVFVDQQGEKKKRTYKEIVLIEDLPSDDDGPPSESTEEETDDDDGPPSESEEEEEQDPSKIVPCPFEDCKCGGYLKFFSQYQCPECHVKFQKSPTLKSLPKCKFCNVEAEKIYEDKTSQKEVNWEAVHISGVPTGLKVGISRPKPDTLLFVTKNAITEYLKEKEEKDDQVAKINFGLKDGTQNKGGITGGGYCVITFPSHSIINHDTMTDIIHILADIFTEAGHDDKCDPQDLLWNFQRKRRQVNGKRKK